MSTQRGLSEQEVLGKKAVRVGRATALVHQVPSVHPLDGALLALPSPQQVHTPLQFIWLLVLSRTLCNPTVQRKGTGRTQPAA